MPYKQLKQKPLTVVHLVQVGVHVGGSGGRVAQVLPTPLRLLCTATLLPGVRVVNFWTVSLSLEPKVHMPKKDICLKRGPLPDVSWQGNGGARAHGTGC
jgi:hypothetical protein